MTERRLRPDDAKLTSLSIGIHDLPTPGPGRLIATLLAACAVGAGLVLAGAGRKRTDGRAFATRSDARTSLLEELASLERAHTSGQVGPRTYERARRELLEALAYTLARARIELTGLWATCRQGWERAQGGACGYLGAGLLSPRVRSRSPSLAHTAIDIQIGCFASRFRFLHAIPRPYRHCYRSHLRMRSEIGWMELTVAKRDLLKLVTRMQGVAERKSTMPVLSNVLLAVDGPSALRVAATDLYLALVGRVTVEVSKGGSVAVPVKDLLERDPDDARRSDPHLRRRTTRARRSRPRAPRAGTRCAECRATTSRRCPAPRRGRRRWRSTSTCCGSSSTRRTSPSRATRPART